MIPPLTDLPTGFRGEELMVAGVPVGAAPTPRFADLLAVEPVSATKVEVQAERFNQDGFFGTSVAMPVAAVAVVLPSAAPEPVVESPVAASAAGPATPAVTPVATTKATAPVVAPLSSVFAKATAPQFVAPVPTTTAPVAASRPPSSRSTPAAPVQPRPPVRRRPLPNGSFVAVAVQAVAHGIEVVAQVAGLDEHDRAALADEVAALLAAHGYAPAHITISAMSGTRQEAR